MKLTMAEIRTIQLRQMRWLDQVCRDHGIEYSLSGGSLLGAIRHRGYIPWDDDIDVQLVRADYDRLIAVLRAELPNGDDALLHYEVRDAYLPFAKIYDLGTRGVSRGTDLNGDAGVSIDIFPMDAWPDAEEERLSFLREIGALTRSLISSNPHGLAYAGLGAWYEVAARAVLFLPQHLRLRGQGRRLARELDALLQRYADRGTATIGYPDYGLRSAAFPADTMAEFGDVAFEDLTLRKVRDHHAYLVRQYGPTYLELPPESERITHHLRWFERRA